MKSGLLLIAGLMILPVSLACAAEELPDKLTVYDAWVRVMPPGQDSTAAYMVLENVTDKDVTVTGAQTDAAKTAELHQMSSVNGMMTMSMVDHMTVPAKSKLKLESGGLHLMLIGLTKPLKSGDDVKIFLTFQEGDQLLVRATASAEASTTGKTCSCCKLPKKEK